MLILHFLKHPLDLYTKISTVITREWYYNDFITVPVSVKLMVLKLCVTRIPDRDTFNSSPLKLLLPLKKKRTRKLYLFFYSVVRGILKILYSH